MLVHQEEHSMDRLIGGNGTAGGRQLPPNHILDQATAEEYRLRLHSRQLCCFRQHPREYAHEAKQRWEKMRFKKLQASWRSRQQRGKRPPATFPPTRKITPIVEKETEQQERQEKEKGSEEQQEKGEEEETGDIVEDTEETNQPLRHLEDVA